MSVEKQPRGPVVFTAIDLYERLATERMADPQAFSRKYSDVMGRTLDGYEAARARAVDSTKAKAGRNT